MITLAYSTRKRKLIESVERETYLISEECLRKWAHLSILKRIELIKKKWNIEVSAYKLKQVYCLNKVKWRRSYYTMKADAKGQEELITWRKAFATKIKAIKESGEPLIYFDEVSSLHIPKLADFGKKLTIICTK